MHDDAVDTLGHDGVWFDPLWRVEVALTPTERALLTAWPVRRLAFVAHAGAASITTTQAYSRLEHSLGVLALVAHFAPDDHDARVTALLHDVGHLPFSHTLEGIAGLEHHTLGRAAVRSLAEDHPIDAERIIALDDGRVASVLTPAHGGLKLDHLDSFLRSGQVHGRTTTPPHELLRRLRLVDGAVDADPDDAAELVDLAVREARAQRSTANLVPVTVLRALVSRAVTDGALDDTGLSAATDDELWGVLAAHPSTAAEARSLRRHPERWRLRVGRTSGVGVYRHVVRRSYLDLPTADGRRVHDPRVDELQASLPYEVAVRHDADPSGAGAGSGATGANASGTGAGSTGASATSTTSATMGPCARTS
ncbi:HD domain-containing protein [Curtobacterium sp. 1P10AnD]|uniref:HD domain-containing protein n=1 Tax=Curtobacterium sp. 1P10AnD TaxID=3132283 RepID=UPI0039A0C18A